MILMTPQEAEHATAVELVSRELERAPGEGCMFVVRNNLAWESTTNLDQMWQYLNLKDGRLEFFVSLSLCVNV